MTFLGPRSATLTFRVYYAGNPSPIIDQPQTGYAVVWDGRWVISSNTACMLANLIGAPCGTGDDGTPVIPTPPDGWDPSGSAPDLVSVLGTLADPDASLEDRVAAVQHGEALRPVIADGLDADRARAGAVRFTVVGVRVRGDDATVLYSVLVDAPTPFETPYPVTAHAVREDGAWRIDANLACGLQGLAQQGCAGVDGVVEGGGVAMTAPTIVEG